MSDDEMPSVELDEDRTEEIERRTRQVKIVLFLLFLVVLITTAVSVVFLLNGPAFENTIAGDVADTIIGFFNRITNLF